MTSSLAKIVAIESSRSGVTGGSVFSITTLFSSLSDYDKSLILYESKLQSNIPTCILPFSKINLMLERTIGYFPVKIRSLIKLIFMEIPRSIRLIKIIKRLNPSIIHLNDGISTNIDGIIAGLYLNKTIILHERKIRSISTLDRIFSRVVDELICISKVVYKNTLQQQYRTKNAKIIYNPIQIDVSEVETNPFPQSTEKMLNIVMPGNIIRWKGHQQVIKNLSALSIPFHCYFLGGIPRASKDYYQKLLLEVNKSNLNNKTTFTGYIEDIRPWLKYCDVMLHASVEPEPFGRVIVEGMQSGCIVVTTNYGASPEIISDGVDGFMIDPKDGIQMNDLLTKIHNSDGLKKNIGENAKITGQKYLPANSVKKIEKIYFKYV